MTTIKPFERQGHFTAVDNVIIDKILPFISGNAWKVLSLILRRNHEDSVSVSYVQISEGTGIGYGALRSATRELWGIGLVIIRKTNKVGTLSYEINQDFDCDAFISKQAQEGGSH